MSLAWEKVGNDLPDGVFCSPAIHLVGFELSSTLDLYPAQLEAFLLGVTQELAHALLEVLPITSVSCTPDSIATFTDLPRIKTQQEVLSADRFFDVEEAVILFNKWRIVNRTVSHHLGLGSRIEVRCYGGTLERKVSTEARDAVVTFAALSIMHCDADWAPSPEGSHLELNRLDVSKAVERTDQPLNLEGVMHHGVLFIGPQVNGQVLQAAWRVVEDGCKAIKLPFESGKGVPVVGVISLPHSCLVSGGLEADVDPESQNTRLEKLRQVNLVQGIVLLTHELKLIVASDSDMIDCILLQFWQGFAIDLSVYSEKSKVILLHLQISAPSGWFGTKSMLVDAKSNLRRHLQ